MSSLSKQEQLFQLIDEQQERIRQTFPAPRSSAVVALTRARDWRYLKLQDTWHAATMEVAAYHSYLYSSGWHKALQFCFGNAVESPDVSPGVTDSTLDAWPIRYCWSVIAWQQASKFSRIVRLAS